MENKETESKEFVYDWRAAKVGRAFLKAIMRDYMRPEVQEDYKRWKEEQAAKETREQTE